MALLLASWLPHSLAADIVKTDSAFTSGDFLYTLYLMDNDTVFSISKNGDYSNNSYSGKHMTGTLVIPDNVEYEGKNYPVAIVDESGFRSQHIDSVVFGSNIVRIYNQAFAFSNVKSVTIPAKVDSIGTEAFEYCQQLNSFVIEEGTKLTDLPSEMLASTAITSFDIPEGIVTIDKSCFDSNSGLTDITIASTLSDPFTVLSKIYYLQNAHVHDSDPNYISYDGVLYTKDGAKLVYFPKNRTSLKFPTTVTELAASVFSESKLEAIDLPASVKTIGERCFSECESLTKANLPGVTSIGSNAFFQCTAMDSVVLGEGLITIPANCFGFCEKLTTINFPSTLWFIDTWAFGYCTSLSDVKLNEGLEKMGNNAFYNCKALEEITIPASIQDFRPVGVDGRWYDPPFENCPNLKHINFAPNSRLKVIPYRFYAGTAVSGEITLPDSLKMVMASAFNDSITTVNLPASVTDLGNEYYGLELGGSILSESSPHGIDCASLQNINVSEYNTTFSSVDGVLFNKEKTELLLYGNGRTAEDYAIPTGVTTIGMAAFSDNRHIISVVIPEGVTTIGISAFSNCDTLTSVTMPSTVMQIYSGAFSYTALNSIDLPEGLTAINTNAFSNSKLKAINFPSTLTTIGEEAFYRTQLTAVKFPTGLKTIEARGFYYSTSLADIDLNGGTPEIGQNAFGNTAWMNNQEDGLIYLGTTLLTYKGSFEPGDSATTEDHILTIKDGTTAISNRALAEYWNVRKVYGLKLPSSLVTIGNEAFTGTSLNTRIVIPDNVTTIGRRAFDVTSNGFTGAWPSFYVGKNVQKIGYYGLFNNLDSITVSPDNPYLVKDDNMLYNKEIGEVFMADLKNIKGTYAIPDGIKYINDPQVFSNTDSITTLIIGKDMVYEPVTYYVSNENYYNYGESVGYSLFNNAFPGVGEYKVNAANTGFTAVDGVLYNKPVTVMLAYPPHKVDSLFVVPSTVTKIDPTAAMGSRIQALVLSPNTVTISYGAFMDSYRLTSVDLGKKLETMGEGAFFNCQIHDFTVPASFKFWEMMQDSKNFYEIENVTFNTIGDIELNTHLMNDWVYNPWTIHYPCASRVTIYNYTDNISLDPYPFVYSNGDIKRVDTWEEANLNPNELYFTVVNTEAVYTNYVVVDDDADITQTTDAKMNRYEAQTEAKNYLSFNVRAVAHAATTDGVRAHAKKIVVTEGSVFDTPVPIETETTSMNAIINTNWRTIALPFDGTIPAGAEVAELNAAGEITAGGTNVNFSKVVSGMKAGKAYLIRNTAAGALDGIMAASDVVEAIVEQDSTAQFIANMDSTITFDEEFTSRNENVGYTFYGLDEATGEFRLMAATDQCPTYRCYLKVGTGLIPTTGGGDPASTIGAKVEDESIATAVNGVTASDATGVEATYNIAGQRVKRNYKGLVIRKGKKTINK